MRNDKPAILIVDDDPAVRDSLQFSLELEGLAVHTCEDGKALLDYPALRQAKCIVLDYKMPGMDGFTVLGELRKRGIDVPVILITGPVTPRIREMAEQAGIHLLLEKPLLDTTLVDHIRKIIA